MAEGLILLENKEWFEKFKAQARRDFELAGVVEHLPYMETLALEELQHNFLLSVMSLETGNALKNLLYRVDISEAQINSAVRKQAQPALQIILADLIIKRILQKVVLKELYK